jgi:hypothetical protein
MYWIYQTDYFMIQVNLFQTFHHLSSNPAIQANPLLSSAVQQFNAQLSLPPVVPPIPLSVSQQLGGALALSPDLAALNAGLNAFHYHQ